MLNTGGYRVNFHNKYGGRIKEVKVYSSSHTAAVASAEKFLKKSLKKYKKKRGDDKSLATSYNIDRRVFNSLDKTADYAR